MSRKAVYASFVFCCFIFCSMLFLPSQTMNFANAQTDSQLEESDISSDSQDTKTNADATGNSTEEISSETSVSTEDPDSAEVVTDESDSLENTDSTDKTSDENSSDMESSEGTCGPASEELSLNSGTDEKTTETEDTQNNEETSVEDDCSVQSQNESDDEEVVVKDPFTSPSTPTFTDVGLDYWARDNIEYLSYLNVIKGYVHSNGSRYFAPSENVTRAQAAKMLIEALGYQPLSVTKSSFSDIPNDHWAIGYIEKAKELKIFDGYADGTFGASDSLKRSQMAKVIVEALQLDYNGYEPSTPVFFDVSTDYWAYDYIERLHYNGISNGSNYRFKPEDRIDRAQFSAFLSRAINPAYKVKVTGPIVSTAKVTANILNVRSSKSTSSTIVGKLALGDVVTVISIDGNWVEIQSGSLRGYVHKTYIKLYSQDPSKPLLDRIIVVDAGHGAHDPGATVGNIYEKDIVLKVSNYLVGYLEAAGAKVVPTRETDTFLTLEERVKFTESVYGEAFVSIHVNAAESTSAKGAEVYYNTETNENGAESKRLANEIQKQLVADAGMYNRGIRDSGFYVIRNNNIPAVLVELGFLTNSEDRAKLTSDEYLRLYAKAIYEGLLEYYKK